MPRDFKLYLNKQQGQHCQLVTAYNIWTYFTGKTINVESKAYEKMVDLVGAKHGTAISIHRLHKKLGIAPDQYGYSMHLTFDDKKMRVVRMPLPFELSIWHKRTGYHSVAVVEYDEKTEAYRVPNFKFVTTSNGWIFGEDLQHYVKAMSRIEPWVARSFRRVRRGRKKAVVR